VLIVLTTTLSGALAMKPSFTTSSIT